MTSTLFACYSHPADPAAFDRHYDEVHAALGLAFPGLRSFTGTRPGPGADGAPAPYYFIAVLTFDDDETMAAALGGPEGDAAIADLATFAQAGVVLMSGPSVTYQ